MVAAFVQANVNTTFSGTSATISAFGVNTTLGNSILVAAHWDGGTQTITNVTDAKGNTYTLVGSKFLDANNQAVQHAYSLNLGSAGAAHTVTVTFSSATSFIRVIAYEVSGLATTGALDQTGAGKAQTGTSVTDNAIVPTADGEFVFVSCMNDDAISANAITAGAGLTKPVNATCSVTANEAVAAYQIQTSAASLSAPWSRISSGLCLMRSSSFKVPASVDLLLGQACL